MKAPSLTLRLFLSICALNIITMLIVGLLGMRSANINISEEYDAQLITEASVLWEILEEDAKNGTIDAFGIESFNAEHSGRLLHDLERSSLLDYAQWRAFRVWQDDKVMMHSDNTDDMPPVPAAEGFSDVTINSEVWRVFALHDPQHKVVVETFENLRSRKILQWDILFDVLGPLLVMLPLLGLLFSGAIRLALTSLRNLARQLSTRSPLDLSRLPSEPIPRELRPLTKAVNTLLASLEHSLAHEREFIDHAAHELRTPLSALKLQAQMLAKSAKDAESPALINELLASVDRTARLVDQLLLLSRVTQQEIRLEPVELHDAVKEVIGMYAVRVVDKHINIDFRGEGNLMVSVQPELLRTLIGTILDNAIKYTPPQGDILVSIEDNRLIISDSGEGIPEAERVRVFDRFYRVADTKQAGSGLGLAIANQIAHLLHASITLETPSSGNGLRVVIAFPPA